MKRIVLMASLVAASACAFAQSKTKTETKVATPATKVQTPATREVSTTVVTQVAFTDQVRQLTTMLYQDQAEAANTKWNEVHMMMTNAMRDVKMKVRTAMEAKNDKDKDANMAVMTAQRTLYMEINQMQPKMMTDKQAMVAKLNEFAATIK